MSVPHALLALLTEGPKYGLRLQNEFESRTGEVWPLNVGQVYTTLQRLERDGLVESDDDADPGPQKGFRITVDGAEELAGWLRTPPDLASPPAQKTKSGLAYRVLQKGTGKQHPGPQSQVEVHYTGWAPDGRMLDSSIERGQPMKMQLATAGKGWTEALGLMVAGEKTRFWIPAELALLMGASVPNMVYDVELIAVH